MRKYSFHWDYTLYKHIKGNYFKQSEFDHSTFEVIFSLPKWDLKYCSYSWQLCWCFHRWEEFWFYVSPTHWRRFTINLYIFVFVRQKNILLKNNSLIWNIHQAKYAKLLSNSRNLILEPFETFSVTSAKLLNQHFSTYVYHKVVIYGK